MARPVSRHNNIIAPIFPVRAKVRFEIHALLAMLAIFAPASGSEAS